LYEKANWDQFKELTQQIINTIDLNAIENTDQIENIAKEFTDSIHLIMNQTIPTKKQFKKSVYWWTQEIGNKRKEVNKLRRKYQRSKDQVQRSLKKEIYSLEKEKYKN
jgi:chromosome condensin MukBEF ATPase and DNA-binding subunit MukB